MVADSNMNKELLSLFREVDDFETRDRIILFLKNYSERKNAGNNQETSIWVVQNQPDCDQETCACNS